MTISDPQLVTVLVYVVAGLFLLQTLFLLVFVDRVNRRVRALERSFTRLSRKALRTLGLARQYLHHLSSVAARLPAVQREVGKLLDIASGKARQADEIAAGSIRLSIAHIEETERRIELALKQFTRQTSKVRTWVRYPAYYISAFIHGAFTGVKVYSRDARRAQPATHVPDDEIFI